MVAPDGESLRLVLCTAPPEQADALARAVVEARLAACVNVIPRVQSVYWWQGAVQSDAESLLIIKTRASLVVELTETIKRAHPYSVPEVISLPLRETEGNIDYIAWLLSETSRTPA